MNENQLLTLDQKLKALEIAVAIHGPIHADAEAHKSAQQFERYNDTASVILNMAHHLVFLSNEVD